MQSLDRALRILAIVADGDGLSLSEDRGAQSGLAASTAYRMLTTLDAHGMVEFDQADQLWSVGVADLSHGLGLPAPPQPRRPRTHQSCRN